MYSDLAYRMCKCSSHVYVRMSEFDQEALSAHGIPESVIKATRAVLLSSVKGVTLKNFTRDYCTLYGKRFPWKRLGFSSAKELLVAMPETVRFEYSDKDGDYRLYGIGTKGMFMPSWVIKAQGNVNKASECSSNKLSEPAKSAQTSPSIAEGRAREQLVYNARGLVTLHITWDSLNKSSWKFIQSPLGIKNSARMKDILIESLSVIAEPTEVSVHSKCYAFARFSLLEDAKRAMNMLNGLNRNGINFRCCPANERMPQGTKKLIVRKNKKSNDKQDRTKPHSMNSSVSHDKANKLCNSQVGAKCPYPMNRLSTADLVSHCVVSESDGSDLEWDDDLLDHLDRYRSPVATATPIRNSDGDPAIILSGHHTANEWGLTPVTISEVLSPERIWVQLAEYPEHDLEALSITVASSNPDTISRKELRAGIYCATVLSGDNKGEDDNRVFRRARVKEVNNQLFLGQPQAHLELIDTGSSILSVSAHHLYKLPSCVSMGVISPLALPTAIADLYSTFNHGEEWFPLDQQLLWQHLRHKMIFAKVVRRPSGQQVGVIDLYFDPAGKDRVCDLLIDKGVFLSSKPLLPDTSPLPQTSLSPTQTTPSRMATPMLCRLSSVLGKLELHNYTPPSQEEKNFSCPKEASDFDDLDFEETNGGGLDMPALERYQLSGDSWSNESDDGCHGDLHCLGNKSGMTSRYLRTECLSYDDDW